MQAQQRFYVVPGRFWSIELQLFSADFTARDALLRFPIGTRLDLEYPDGTVRSLPLDQDGAAQIASVPRGLYHVKIGGGSGYAPRTPLALSRDQSVELLMISYLDMALVGASLGIFALAILFFGRIWRRR